jgi:hypothetical protein
MTKPPDDQFWMITISYSDNGLATIAIDEHPAEWFIKWGCHMSSVVRKDIVFALQISKDQYTAINNLRP